MELREKDLGDIFVIEISGRMDTLNSKDLDAKLNNAIGRNMSKIIIDLTAVDYISSVGLRVLLASLKKQKANKRSLELANLQPFVRGVFKVTGLDKIFTIYSTQEEAIEGIAFE
ncbi:STAS domain protein [uncultured archaeon]|nr:STAS domain protein [uncultured archaeon]